MSSLIQPGTTRRLILNSGLANPDELQGCSLQELAEVEEALGLKPLPAAYRQFMLEAGRGAGRFARYEHIFYPHVLETIEVAREVLELPNPAIPNREYYFYQHECYEYYFFDLSNPSNDPPVFLRLERDVEKSQAPELLAESFTKFIIDWIKADQESLTKCNPDELLSCFELWEKPKREDTNTP